MGDCVSVLESFEDGDEGEGFDIEEGFCVSWLAWDRGGGRHDAVGDGVEAEISAMLRERVGVHDRCEGHGGDER